MLDTKPIDPAGGVDRCHSFVEVRDRFSACIDEIKALGVGVTNRGRFIAYKDILDDLARLPRPFLFDPVGEAERWRRASIALSEAYQLIQASLVWPRLNRDGLVALLRKIRKGEPFAENDQIGQEARNKGLELATATHLHKLGFDVDVTINDADVIARAASFGHVVVECKRPQNMDSVSKNIMRARDQIAGRGRHGIVVVGIDKVVGLGERASIASTTAELDARLDVLTKQEFRRVVEPIVEGLYPTVLAVGIVFSAIVFVDDGTVQQRDVAAFGPTIPEEHRDHAELADRFDGLRQRA